MPHWDAKQYLRFAEERTRPCRELATRVAVESPRRIVDLGCGPGNSTLVLAERWPAALLTGIDSSPDMIDAARRDWPADRTPAPRWEVGDIASWRAGDDEQCDVAFSNAALQWVSDHRALYPHLLAQVAPGGALAVQVPYNYDAAPHRIAREIAASAGWRNRFPSEGVREWHVHHAEYYYDLIAPHAARIDLWETEYLQVMENVEAIVAWYQGTGLRPYLQALAVPEDRERFLAEYRDALRPSFPARVDGKVLFPFRRLFLIAYRGR